MKQVYLFKYGLTVLLFICAISAFAQKNSFTGKVVDESSQPLPGATVTVKGTQQSTVTDANGKFSFAGNNQSAIAVVISFVGYDAAERTLTVNEPATFQLVPNQKSLSEVVVVGYGTVKKTDLTGAVSNLHAKDLNPGPITNPLQQLEGKAAGVNITQVGSEPGTAPSVRIRGITSLQGGNDPLYVVDGVQGNSDLLNQVPPSEIASVDILKDASATAIYGSRGAPGVIIITTKRNAAGVSTLEYTENSSIDVIPKKLHELTAAEWSTNAAALGVDPSANHGSNTDWYDLLTKDGYTQNHTIAFGGASKDFNYRASLSSIYQNGVVVGSSQYHNYIGRITATQKALDDRLTITMNLNSGINNADYSGPPGGKIGNAAFTSALIANAYIQRPTDPVYNEDGTYFTDNATVFQYLNPVAAAKNLINNVANNNLFGSLRTDLDIYKGLSAGFFGSWRKVDGDNGSYEPAVSTYTPAIAQKGIASVSNNHTDERLMDIDLAYKHDFGKSHIDAIGLYEWQAQTYNGASATARGFINDDLTYNSLQSGTFAAALPGDVSSYKNQRRLVSFLGRINYSYDNKYFLTASMRNDGSTVFGANYKRGNFPSAALAWKIDQENFMKDQHVVSSLKLRGGYGVTGNQQGLGPLNSIQLLQSSGVVPFGGQQLTNYSYVQNYNPDLRWETRKQSNIGLDFGFFNDRLTGTIDAYNATTSNLLYSYPVVVEGPFIYPTFKGNAGTLNNKGLELSLSYTVIRTENTTLTLAGNASYLKNKVINLSGSFDGQPLIANQVPWGNNAYLIAGQPIGTYMVFKHLGVNSAGGETYVDLNNNGKIDPDAGTLSPDRYNAGQSLPKYAYAFTPSFSYKNFDASMVWYGAGGNKIYNQLEESLSLLDNIGKSNLLESAIPKGIHSVTYGSDEWLQSGSYLRFANLSFGYKFDVTHVKYISALRISLTGQNLALITKYQGLDPEVDASGGGGTGVDNGGYPRTRTFSLGLNVILK